MQTMQPTETQVSAVQHCLYDSIRYRWFLATTSQALPKSARSSPEEQDDSCTNARSYGMRIGQAGFAVEIAEF